MSKAESGFTLIEILVSMSIGIVLIYLLSETLAVTQTGWTRANRLGQITTQEDRATRILRHMLAYMQPPAPDGREHTLIASNDAFEFSTLPPQSRADWGLMRARVAVEPADGGLFTLVLELAPTKDTQTIAKYASRRVLLSGLATAHVSYYYEGPDAVSVGQPRSDLVPELVVISWSYPDSVKDMRELVVRPRISLSGRCHLDLTSGTCRAS